jgi:TPR repeat protein
VDDRAERLARRAVLRERVRKGDARAALLLGRSLERDPPRDHAAARRAYALAAEAGLAEAQAALGEMLRDGRAGKRELPAAVALFRAAAAQGHPAAALALAGALLHGEGVARDRAAALRLYRRAAAAGSAEAAFAVAECLRDGVGVARAPGAALRWFRRAARLGHAGASAAVGQAYWWGSMGAPRDRTRAAPFLLAAARRGDARARELLAERGG